MFRVLICPSSGVCDCVVELPHWLISFCEDGGVFVSVNLWCLVVFVWCDMCCRFVVASNMLLSMLTFICVLLVMFSCV